MVDNLKSAVLQRLIGAAPVFNPKYLDFSRHWGFEIKPCNVRSGNEKGRVENGVGYVKKNFLAGLELPDFAALQPAATLWMDAVANVRMHESTHQRPIDRFEEERARLLRPNPAGFDLARVSTVRATKQFRVPLDSNHYTVPARYAGTRLTLKAYADRVCIYDHEQLVVRHPRSMDRHRDIEDPEHERQLLVQRKSAREQRLVMQFLAICPRAQSYREALEAKHVNARTHLRKIVALVEMHGKEAVSRAIDDGLKLQAFSAEEAPRLRPYMALAEKLGKLVGQVVGEDIKGIAIEVEGAAAQLNQKPITGAVLAGLMGTYSDTVNMVNAPVLAKERGLDVKEVRHDREGDYHTLVSVEATTDKGVRRVAGTLFGNSGPRLVEMFGVEIEAELDGSMIYIVNTDAPGFIGKLGTALGQAGINIATFNLGRRKARGDAASLVAVDGEVSPAVVDTLCALDGVRKVVPLKF